MIDRNSFRYGYEEGWKAVLGSRSNAPLTEERAPAKGRTPFQEGLRQGVAAALEYKKAGGG